MYPLPKQVAFAYGLSKVVKLGYSTLWVFILYPASHTSISFTSVPIRNYFLLLSFWLDLFMDQSGYGPNFRHVAYYLFSLLIIEVT